MYFGPFLKYIQALLVFNSSVSKEIFNAVSHPLYVGSMAQRQEKIEGRSGVLFRQLQISRG